MSYLNHQNSDDNFPDNVELNALTFWRLNVFIMASFSLTPEGNTCLQRRKEKIDYFVITQKTLIAECVNLRSQTNETLLRLTEKDFNLSTVR